MESWTPRRPSPTLKARIFGSEATAAPLESTLFGLDMNWRFLATATAAFLMLLILAGAHPSTLTRLSSGNLSTLALSQPDFASYLGNHSPHNNLALNDASFASTTPAPTLSTHPSLLGTNTVRP